MAEQEVIGVVADHEEIPKLGGPSWIGIVIIVGVVAISIVLYKKLREYKEVK